MKCPHCATRVHLNTARADLSGAGKNLGQWHARYGVCPSCKEMIITLVGVNHPTRSTISFLADPKVASRSPLSKEVPGEFAQDYREACLVLNDSPKASAALARRCLQHVLREAARVKHANLAQEIQEVLDSHQLPSYLADAIDGVRNIGNLAAHPLKSTNTGEVVDVEAGEAEWLLDTLESLFDFYFVQPAILKEKREKLNEKLKDAGKPDMK